MAGSGKTALVTGGAGFIGSHLCERLVRDGCRVISLDNYFTGLKENHVEGVEYREGHTKDVERHVLETPDIVYHLGEYARVEQSFEDVPIVMDFNVVGTAAVLEFCRKRSAKLVYAGSSTKFGDKGLGIHQSPYAWTKAANTELVKNYGNWFDLRYAITYFYNVYGPRERAGMYNTHGTVIQSFIERYQQGLPLQVTSPGTQRPNFTDVCDIIEGLVLVGEKGEGEEYGLGCEESYTILEIAELFGTDIEMLPARKGTRMASSLDTTKAKALGWETTRTIREYIQEMIKS